VELPRLQTIREKYQDQGFEVIAIESNRETERALAFIAKAGLEFPCVENGEGDDDVVNQVFRIQGYPTSWVVDRQGRIMFRHYGWHDGEEKEIEAEVLSLL
jgi:thiol-disulfide isomerase/thioredoxin